MSTLRRGSDRFPFSSMTVPVPNALALAIPYGCGLFGRQFYICVSVLFGHYTQCVQNIDSAFLGEALETGERQRQWKDEQIWRKGRPVVGGCKILGCYYKLIRAEYARRRRRRLLRFCQLRDGKRTTLNYSTPRVVM